MSSVKIGDDCYPSRAYEDVNLICDNDYECGGVRKVCTGLN